MDHWCVKLTATSSSKNLRSVVKGYDRKYNFRDDAYNLSGKAGMG
jgi:hypothetical protein